MNSLALLNRLLNPVVIGQSFLLYGGGGGGGGKGGSAPPPPAPVAAPVEESKPLETAAGTSDSSNQAQMIAAGKGGTKSLRIDLGGADGSTGGSSSGLSIPT